MTIPATIVPAFSAGKQFKEIVILNSEKFESLPESVQTIVQKAFDIRESSGTEAQRINDALLQELMVLE